MLIGEVAERTGVASRTLRFYEGRGLLPDPGRSANGYREYVPEAVERVRFIRDAQAAGLTLAQVGQVLDVRDASDPPCGHVVDLVARRLADVERRLEELRGVRDQLQDIAGRAESFDPANCVGYCGLISGDVAAEA